MTIGLNAFEVIFCEIAPLSCLTVLVEYKIEYLNVFCKFHNQTIV